MSETPLTDLREKHQRDYHAYYERHPEQTLKDQARQSAYQDETRATADRHGEAWTGSDEEIALDLDSGLSQSAAETGRTYAAVRQGRYRLVRYYDLSNSSVKREHDEYMALMRRKDFTREDVMAHKKKWHDKNQNAKAGLVE